MAAVPPKPSAADVLKKLREGIGKVANIQKVVGDAAAKQAAPAPPPAKKV